MTANKDILIGVVGPCGAGKTSLTDALASQGYTSRHIAQEHSYVKDMWKRLTNPGLLVFLDVSYQVSQTRRPMNWTESDFHEQQRRLSHAREHADLYLKTDDLSISQVLEQVLAFIEALPR
jgi:cytidylate kinase